MREDQGHLPRICPLRQHSAGGCIHFDWLNSAVPLSILESSLFALCLQTLRCEEGSMKPGKRHITCIQFIKQRGEEHVCSWLLWHCDIMIYKHHSLHVQINVDFKKTLEKIKWPIWKKWIFCRFLGAVGEKRVLEKVMILYV